MALFKKRAMKKETARKKRYLKHYKKAGPKHAMSYAQWLKAGEKPVYFKGVRKGTIESRLREAGVSPERFKRKK